MLRAFFKLLSGFVNGDLPEMSDFSDELFTDTNLRIETSTHFFGVEGTSRIVGDNVSIVYVWTKKGEDQTETLEVKLKSRRGIFTATCTNIRLVELTLNGWNVPHERLVAYEEEVRSMLTRVRMLEETEWEFEK